MITLTLDAIEVGERSRTETRNVESLARSISERSLIQPPVVRREGERYVLVAGLRRLTAMRSLGWTETPVVIAETITDELAALYAEGDENTEREPFTTAEAVEHRRRIRDAEARAAKERQRQAGKEHGRGQTGSANLAEPKEPAHQRTTRTRTAKATGYSGPTLDKAERVLEVASDETQPEPVRKVARQSAEKLAAHGAKVDREFRAVEQAVAENSDQAQAYRDAQWRKRLLAELGKVGDLKTFEPERIVAVCDDDQIYLIDSICEGVAKWHAEIKELRRPGLRVVRGGVQ